MHVSIYKLECGISEKPLCSFSNGVHVLGRGSILQCIDNRVSRRHISVSIDDEHVQITAKHHMNPLFYRASNSTHISILKHENPSDLSDGDTFGFFPDNYWFKVKINSSGDMNRNTEIGNPGLVLANDVLSVINNNIPQKRSSDDSTLSNKKQRLSDPHERLGDSNLDRRQDFECATTSTYNYDFNNSSMLDSDSRHDIKTVAQTLIVENMQDVKVSTVPDGVNVEYGLQNIPSSASNVTHVDNFIMNVCNIKQEIPCEDLSPISTPVRNNLADSMLGSDSILEREIKVERPNEPSDGNTNNTAAVVNNADNRKEFLTQSMDIDVSASCSSGTNSDPNSGAGPSKKTVRDRCWYGSACYRKNTQHKQEFSHPNDPDYDTDPEDNRPICDFGTRCYRRNPEHRRDYRHPKPDGSGQPRQPQGPNNIRATSPIQRNNGPVEESDQAESDNDSNDLISGINPANIITSGKRTRKKVNRFTDNTEFSDDDSDGNFDEPFKDDGTDDEYKPVSESDTELDESQSQP